MSRRGRTALALAWLVGVAVWVGAASGSRTVSRVEGPFGSGADAVWLVRPQGPPTAVVVFGHGWKLFPPSPSGAWVCQFRPWLDHLAARGDAVVFPRYQLGGDTTGPARVASFRAGLAEAFARLGASGLPVVAAGYSFGGTLAFYYAAEARRWHLPVPRAVLAVFPAGLVPGVPLDPLPSSVWALVQVGDRDASAGRSGGDALWASLARVPAERKRFVVVRSGPALTAIHSAPKLDTPGARHAFWAPLDALIARAR